jgi:hypothetical protein
LRRSGWRVPATGALDGNTNAGAADLLVVKYDSDGNRL